MSEKKAKILEYCINHNREITAKEILNELYPNKQQAHINSAITELVYEGKLIRNDSLRPYTVRIPKINEESNVVKNYSRQSINVKKISNSNKNSSIPDELKFNFNNFWSTFFNEDRDFYSEISFEKLIELKMIVGKINNLVTYELTMMALELISNIIRLSNSEKEGLVAQLISNSVNANGYDIEYCGINKFVCEVKGSIPIGGGNRFGAQQEKEIKKDINGLINGKSKSQLSSFDLKDYYKFMCFYNSGLNSIDAIEVLLERLSKEMNFEIKIYKNHMDLSKDCINVLIIPN